MLACSGAVGRYKASPNSTGAQMVLNLEACSLTCMLQKNAEGLMLEREFWFPQAAADAKTATLGKPVAPGRCLARHNSQPFFLWAICVEAHPEEFEVAFVEKLKEDVFIH